MYVNDGSKDKTWDMIEEIANKEEYFSGVKLSRNRGHQNALLAGLMTAKKYADIVCDFSGHTDAHTSAREILRLAGLKQ